MLFIIVPVHNRIESTKQFLNSLFKQEYKDFKVVIVDDGSNDNTHLFVKKNYPDIELLNGDGNLFWGGAINKGLAYLENIVTDADLIAFANNDVLLATNTIFNLIKRVKENKNALYHPVSVDGTNTCISSGAQLKSWIIFNTYHPFRGRDYNVIKDSPIVQVDFATARFLLFSASLLKVVSRIDTKRFQHYIGDYDFSMQMKKHSINTYIVPESKCIVDTKTTGNNPSQIDGIIPFFRSLNSIKSTNNIKIRFLFGRKYCPLYFLPFYFTATIIQVAILNFWKRK